jgi:nitrogen fixation/metabolism regulation signal transduction histidine kinase
MRNEPSVTLTTKKSNGKIEISVKDNGNGIPQKYYRKDLSAVLHHQADRRGLGLGTVAQL